MKILFTGASSFTGCWFARALADAGHDVTAVFLRDAGEYRGLRRQRIRMLDSMRHVFGTPFGSRAFLQLAGGERWDVLCHHAAVVGDYKNPAFDALAAVKQNTRNLSAVLARLGAGGCSRIVLTGSVFESGEGGGRNSAALSPYGLSKSMTTDYFRHDCARANLRLGHFVIPNPFGPLEEPRFTAYLMKTWKNRETAAVHTPDYVRDNIHVDLLAGAYTRFVAALPAAGGFSRLRPSGYIQTQGDFARRFAREMRRRLALECGVRCERQRDFSEPMTRTNSQPPDARALRWSEKAAWDRIADYYR